MVASKQPGVFFVSFSLVCANADALPCSADAAWDGSNILETVGRRTSFLLDAGVCCSWSCSCLCS